jgi:biotin transporter BioY
MPNEISDYTYGKTSGIGYNFWSRLGAYHTLGNVAASGRPTSGSSGGGDGLVFLALFVVVAFGAYGLLLAIIEAYTLGFAVYEYFLNGFRSDPGLGFVVIFLLFLASQVLLPVVLIRSRQIIAALALIVAIPVLNVLVGLVALSLLSSLQLDVSSIAARLPNPPLSGVVGVDTLKKGIAGGLIVFWFLVIAAVTLWHALVWLARLGIRGSRHAGGSRTGEVVFVSACVAYLGLCERLMPNLYYLPLGVESFGAIGLAMLVGWRRAVVATATWLSLSSAGFPLADQTMLQPQVLFGPLMGFLVGLLLAVALAGWLGYGRWAIPMIATAVGAHVIYYGCGLGWFLLTRPVSTEQVASDILLPTAYGLLASIVLTAVLFEATAAASKRAMELELHRAGGLARFTEA